MRERRARLNAISARLASHQYTPEDVAWLRDVVEEYLGNWERGIERYKSRAKARTDASWRRGAPPSNAANEPDPSS